MQKTVAALSALVVILACSSSGGSEEGSDNSGASGLRSLILPVRYISQYSGNSNQACDCGPTSVAMVQRFYGLAGGIDDKDLIDQNRSRSKIASCTNLSYIGVARIAQSYVTGYSWFWSDIPAGANMTKDGALLRMRRAIALGYPAIIFIDGAELGRGDNYLHWMVAVGFAVDASRDPYDETAAIKVMYVNDPDSENGGGRADPVEIEKFKRIMADSKGRYGLVVTPPAGAFACGNPCTQAILSQRSDIINVFRDGGWDTSCRSHDSIIAHWCNGGVSPAAMDGCVAEKREHPVCTFYPTQFCGSWCTQAILANRFDIQRLFWNSGWVTACDNHEVIVNHWCSANPNDWVSREAAEDCKNEKLLHPAECGI
jgi:hypothetical protein